MSKVEKKLKILIPIFGFGKSGGHRVLSELANNWILDGHQVEFVTHYTSDNPYYPIKAKITWINIKGNFKLVNVPYNIKGNFKNNICGIFKFIKKNASEYDIILANYCFTAIPVYLAGRSNFYYIQAYEPDFFTNRNFKGILYKFLAWVTYFLPLTRIVNAEIYKNYKNIRSKYVIPPGLNLDIYYPKKLKKVNKDEIVVGCIGRKEVWKGSEDVGEAVKILHEEGYKIKFKVAFNPVKYENHELVYPDGDENLADFYRSLDILVAPGHIQLGAIHYPVIEAMACNVPVITTGYYPANDENSFIVPIKRPVEIAETIKTIINDYTIAMKKAKKAREDIQQFDWKIVSKKFIDVFEETISKKNNE